MSSADEPRPEGEAAEEVATLSPEEQAAAMADYAATLRRVQRTTVVLGVLASAVVAWPLGWWLAAGVLLGALLGVVNFRSLAASVSGVADRIVNQQSEERGAVIVVRGVGRIFLIAIVAYGIFSCSVRGLVGFLAGLAMPVIALMCEAAYEFVAGPRRSS